jgi:hypothetical protein
VEITIGNSDLKDSFIKFPTSSYRMLGNLFEIPTIALSLRLNSFQFSAATDTSCFAKKKRLAPGGASWSRGKFD